MCYRLVRTLGYCPAARVPGHANQPQHSTGDQMRSYVPEITYADVNPAMRATVVYKHNTAVAIALCEGLGR
jgi:hypothetical protein